MTVFDNNESYNDKREQGLKRILNQKLLDSAKVGKIYRLREFYKYEIHRRKVKDEKGYVIDTVEEPYFDRSDEGLIQPTTTIEFFVNEAGGFDVDWVTIPDETLVQVIKKYPIDSLTEAPSTAKHIALFSLMFIIPSDKRKSYPEWLVENPIVKNVILSEYHVLERYR